MLYSRIGCYDGADVFECRADFAGVRIFDAEVLSESVILVFVTMRHRETA